MGLAVIQFSRKAPTTNDWSQQDLAEFYRVESALIQGGLRIETDRGLTDEGDPWFVFCRENSYDPVVHFARIGSEYLIASPAFDGVVRGRDFPSLVRDLISRYHLLQASERLGGSIFLHPVAILIAIVGTAFFKASDANAADSSQDQSHQSYASTLSCGVFEANALSAMFSSTPAASKAVAVEINRNYVLVALAAAMSLLDINTDQSIAAVWSSAAIFVAEEAKLHPSSAASQTIVGTVADHDAPAVKFADTKPIDLAHRAIEQAIVLVATLKDLPTDPQHSAYAPPCDNSNVRLETLTNETVTAVDRVDLAHPDPLPFIILYLNEAKSDLPQIQSVKLVVALARAVNIEVSVANADLSDALAALFMHGRSIQETGSATQFFFSHQDIFSIPSARAETPNLPSSADGRFAASSSATTCFSDNVTLSNSLAQGGIDVSSNAMATILKNYLHENVGSKLIITQDSYVFTPKDGVTSSQSLESFNVKFSDGSSISLVGQHLALQHIFDVIA